MEELTIDGTVYKIVESRINGLNLKDRSKELLLQDNLDKYYLLLSKMVRCETTTDSCFGLSETNLFYSLDERQVDLWKRCGSESLCLKNGKVLDKLLVLS